MTSPSTASVPPRRAWLTAIWLWCAGVTGVAWTHHTEALAGHGEPASSAADDDHMPTASPLPLSARRGQTAVSARSSVYGARRPAIRFEHGRHLDQGLTCGVCHAEATTSTRSGDDLRVKPDRCDGCHDTQHPWAAPSSASTSLRTAPTPASCETCHIHDASGGRRVRRVQAPLDANLVFNHALHLPAAGGCEGCHGDMRAPTSSHAVGQSLPDEATCTTCHDGLQAASDCGVCHPRDGTGRLVLARSSHPGAPRLLPQGAHGWGMAHDLEFVHDHGAAATRARDTCQDCHAESDCQDCHAGAIRPLRIHRPDYVRSHAVDARAMASNCETCHRLQTDCMACHERLGFGPAAGGAFVPPSSGRFHPSDWASVSAGPQGHAQAARTNIRTCVSCHQEDTCLSCHATTLHAQPGLDVNPHGPGFVESMRCQQLARANRRVCLRCHAPDQVALDCVTDGRGGGLFGGVRR